MKNEIVIMRKLADKARLKTADMRRFIKLWSNMDRAYLMATHDVYVALQHEKQWVKLSMAGGQYQAVVWSVWRAIVDDVDGKLFVNKGFCYFEPGDLLDVSDIHASEEEVAKLEDVDPYDPFSMRRE